MANELVLSCYLVRMRQKHNAIQIEVQDVRSGRILHFHSMEVFLADLSKRLEENGVAKQSPFKVQPDSSKEDKEVVL
jgi:hypothetical protein